MHSILHQLLINKFNHSTIFVLTNSSETHRRSMTYDGMSLINDFVFMSMVPSYCASCLAAICVLTVLTLNGDHSFYEYFAAMRYGKALTNKEKEVIIK